MARSINMDHQNLKKLELLGLFILVPLLLVLTIPIWIKITVVALGLIWLIYQSKRIKLFKTSFKWVPITKSYIRRMVFVSTGILILGSLFLYYYNSKLLFSVAINKPLLWIMILFIYTFLSVLPQEFIYRRFFFNRYEGIFKNDNYLFVLNVVCFSLCHAFLLNGWVLLLTAIGGVLFAFSYKNCKNLNWLTFEHAIYGNLIFTIGLGEMLAFPS